MHVRKAPDIIISSYTFVNCATSVASEAEGNASGVRGCSLLHPVLTAATANAATPSSCLGAKTTSNRIICGSEGPSDAVARIRGTVRLAMPGLIGEIGRIGRAVLRLGGLETAI